VVLFLPGMCIKKSFIFHLVFLLRNFLIVITISIATISVMEYKNCIMFITDRQVLNYSDCVFLCMMPMSFFTLAEIQLSSFVILLKYRFSILNGLIIQNNGVNKPATKTDTTISSESIVKVLSHDTKVSGAENMKILKMMHEELQEAFQMINLAFSLQNILLVLWHFIQISSLSYDICIKFLR
jgi:hypothetical protein